jgi:hypothetical protein
MDTFFCSGSRNGHKGKGMTNKGLTIKPIQGQFNTMEVKFARLEVLIINMVAHVNFNASKLRKAKNKKDGQSSGLDVDPRYFYGILNINGPK